jgi:hypothetical protein
MVDCQEVIEWTNSLTFSWRSTSKCSLSADTCGCIFFHSYTVFAVLSLPKPTADRRGPQFENAVTDSLNTFILGFLPFCCWETITNFMQQKQSLPHGYRLTRQVTILLLHNPASGSNCSKHFRWPYFCSRCDIRLDSLYEIGYLQTSA